VGDDRRAEHVDADHVEDPRDAGAGDLLVDDHLLDRAEALAADLGGPGHPGEAALGQPALPAAPRQDVGVVLGAGPRAARLGGLVAVLAQPRAHPLAIGGLLGRVVEVHPVSFG
jgi:hypothetical protein